MVACSVLLAVAVAQQPGSAAELARIPIEAPITVAFPKPGELVRQAARGFRESGGGDFGSTSIDLDAGLLNALAEFGVELDDPATWDRIGVAADKPMRYSLADPGGWLGLPETAWLSFGLSDEARALRFLEAVNGAPERIEGEPVVFACPDSAWCTFGGDAWFLSTTSKQVEDADRLREVISAVAESPTLGSDPMFKTLASRVEGAVSAALWIEVERFSETGPLRAILGVVSDRGIEVGLAPAAEANWFKNVRAGGTARELLSRFDRPVIAMSASLAEPMGVLDGFEHDEAIDEDLGDILQGVLEHAGEDFEQRLENTSIGVLLYPRGREFHDPRAALCVHVFGVDAVLRRARELAESGDLPLELDGKWLRGRIDNKDVVLGAVGDYLVFGDAVDEIRRASRAKPGIWSPEVGGRSVFAFEVDVLALGLASEGRADDDEIASLEREGRLVVEFEPTESCLAVRSRFVGAADDVSFVNRSLRIVGMLLDF